MYASCLAFLYVEDHEVALYKRLVREHRGTPLQVGARSARSQEARFVVILDVLDSMLGERLRGLSLVDFGCGKGDLVAYLERRGRMGEIRYIGVDAIEENLEDARGLGDHDFRLKRWDGSEPLVEEGADLIVFSGTLATSRMERRIPMFRSLLEQARVGVVGNFLTWTPVVADWGGAIPMEPKEALAAVDHHKFRVQLRADYLRHDFTVGAIRWDWRT